MMDAQTCDGSDTSVISRPPFTSSLFKVIKGNGNQKNRIGKKYKMFDLEARRSAVRATQYMPIQQVAKIFGVPYKSLKRWCLVGPERQKGGGRKIKDPQMEDILIQW